MDIKKTLADFKREIDREINAFFTKAIKETRKHDQFVAEALEYTRKFVLAGGKRLRPALMYWSYLGVGGKEREKMMKTAVSIELIHNFLLIHDDIIDRDDLRHGMETLNSHYAKVGEKHFRLKDGKHFGDSMAIIIGDMVGALGSQIIFNSGFPDRAVMKALTKLQSIVSMTVIGQSKDIYMEYRKKATEKEVTSMYEHKTAKYTIEGPLHLGAILGGADKKMLESLSLYAIPVGIAFQIQDDILGIFGSEEKLGKVLGSDIAEGKQTILLIKARERADKKQKMKLEAILQKGSGITSEDIFEFRRIIEDTGALKYSQELAVGFIEKGKSAAIGMRITDEVKNFLLGIAEYMIKREI